MTDSVPAKDHGRRLRAGERDQAAKILLKRYESGESIRDLATSSGYSIGLVRNLLLEAGATLRPKGGSARAQGSKR
ncbi:helix-turn-helix domain-containing protein [Geodermatophilus sp. SYSU D00079]